MKAAIVGFLYITLVLVAFAAAVAVDAMTAGLIVAAIAWAIGGTPMAAGIVAAKVGAALSVMIRVIYLILKD
jgi:hypothetical protein